MKPKRILILEDDLETLSLILNGLTELGMDISPIVLSEYTQVEEWINNTNMHFDLILLDRDCNLGGSFHILDIEKHADKIISISSVPPYNEEALVRGVKQFVHKDYQNLDSFIYILMKAIKESFAGAPKWERKGGIA